MKKSYLFIFGGVVIISLLVSVLFINAKIAEDQFDDGVKHIRIAESDAGEKLLNIEHGGDMYESSSYSIRIMDKEEREYLGERLVEADGLLGRYRIEIMFYDTKGSPALAKEYPLGTVHEINDVSVGLKSKYKIRIAYPPDDSKFVIYIGSDEPINVKEQESKRIGNRKGNIELILEN